MPPGELSEASDLQDGSAFARCGRSLVCLRSTCTGGRPAAEPLDHRCAQARRQVSPDGIWYQYRSSKRQGCRKSGVSVWRGKGNTGQRSPIFLAPGTGFVEDNFSMDGDRGEV